MDESCNLLQKAGLMGEVGELCQGGLEFKSCHLIKVWFGCHLTETGFCWRHPSTVRWLMVEGGRCQV